MPRLKAASTFSLFLAATMLTPAEPAWSAGFTQQELEGRAVHRGAVEAVFWGMPAVNYDLMLQEMLSRKYMKRPPTPDSAP